MNIEQNEQYKSLYRKWRPKSFDNVIGQEHITSILKNQIITNKTSHAYLLCGTRGTGKTTCAKVFSKAINCENSENGNPCNKCTVCTGIDGGTIVDVVEIDAASNNGVDNIRVIRDEVFYMPSQVKKKVYIVDEVHMLSIGAFNALLKILEEPPSHVVFILATTELHKIPATILSRCQRHDFRRISSSHISSYIKKIADIEKINIDINSAELIAKLSSGALRDALSMLEMCRGIESSERNDLSYDEIKELLGVGDRDKLLDILRYAVNGDAKSVLEIFWNMFDNSKNVQNFVNELFELLRDVEIAKIISSPYNYIDAPVTEVDKIIETAKSASPQMLMQFNEIITQTLTDMTKITSNRKVLIEMMLISLCQHKLESYATNIQPLVNSSINTEKSEQTTSILNQDSDVFRQIRQLNQFIQNKFLVSFLDQTKCYINDDTKTFNINCFSEFTYLSLNKPDSKKEIQEALKKLLNIDYNLEINLKNSSDSATNTGKGKGNIQDLINKTENGGFEN